MLYSQLSPGDLAKVHEHLEGTMNCTQCHTLGESVSNEKCLNCHKELKSRIDQRKGYHVSVEVQGKSCASCHNDHHGRNFQIVRFDEKSFNHNKTGYELTGKHAKIDCRECHKASNITNEEIRIKKYTYLGLDQKCNSCHKDYHQNTISRNCAECHTTDAFTPATKFKHERTKFALSGQHKIIDCKACHKIEIRNGEKFQRFAGIEFNSCANCHTDVHKKALGNRCNECHKEESFKIFIGNSQFNHNKTPFPLKGQHKKQDCSKCHNLNLGLVDLFQDKHGIKVDECAKCHQDVHEGKFGIDCKQCHTEDGFRKLTNLNKFDHTLTQFKLEGKHEKVDCKLCHKTKFTDPVEHNSCAACHTDYHKGELSIPERKRDCAECHTTAGFKEFTYSIEEHNKTKFPLEGAHLATPCIACHQKEKTWQFRDIGQQCKDCHTDIHKGFIGEKYYPDQNCSNCHSSENWTAVQFDHKLTGYSLVGKHAETNCMDCHGLKENQSGNRFSNFSLISSSCINCHQNVHGDQFTKNGVTNCESCHDFTSWQPTRFNHDSTAFKLEGKHKEISCNACHKPVKVNEQLIIQYKFEKFECVICHH